MTLRRATLVGIAALVCVAMVVAVRRPWHAPKPSEHVPTSPVVDGTPLPRSEKSESTPLEAEAVVPKTPSSAPKPPATSVVEAARPAAAISGTIEVLDENGGWHAHEAGSFLVAFWADGGWHLPSVDVEDGRWACELPLGVAFTVERIRLGDRDATFVGDESSLQATPGALLGIRARWPSPSLLHVREAATSRELSNVQLLEGHRWLWTATHAARDSWRREIADNLTSPIELGGRVPSSLGIEEFSVRAPGFAWSRVAIDLVTGGERFVDLRPGGDLDVDVVSPSDLGDAFLVLRRAGVADPVDVANLTSAGLLRIPSLEPGRWTLTVQFGQWESPEILGTADVEVVAGETARVKLVLASPATPDFVTVAGVVRVPKAWGVTFLSLTAHCLGNVRRLEDRERQGTLDQSEPDGAFDLFPFEIADVVPGRWRLDVTELRTRTTIDVGEKGRDDVVIEVPPPGHVSIRVVDIATGDDAPVQLVLLTWPDDDLDGAAGWQCDPETGRFEGDLPIGEAEVSLEWYATPFECEPLRFAVGPGRNDVELRVHAAEGVRLRALEGDLPVPWDSAWPAHLRAIDHDGHEVRTRFDRGAATLVVSQPGRYRLSVGPIDGRAAVPDREVVVEPGHATDVVVRFERE